ncbi:cytochrome P450 [Phanerochaete sordida]|uniref:Cytochrome P450 n=1 Tax=Phanerochaete sordida TaxID=48140 RepID=A0A9P3FXI7_9APHY|nr:cytochrome P450 [Phanerochaete sordida]
MESLILACFVLIGIALRVYSQRRRLRLPPGPKGLPILGNVFDIPPKHEWLAYERWGREYGSDIIYLNLAGTPMVVLNSAQAVNDLLEKRSSIYSDRPVTVMAYELVGLKRNFGFIPYGEIWRQHRRMFHQHFRLENVTTYHPHIVEQAKDLLRRLISQPEAFIQNLRLEAGTTTLRIMYGIDVQPENDPYIAAVDEAIEAIALTGNAGSYVVDALPILQYLPNWLPGARFKRDAVRWHGKVTRMITEPFEYTKHQMAEGKPINCVAASLLSAVDEKQDENHADVTIQNALFTGYVGGVDTTVSSLASFILAMILHPGVQHAAQMELDRVVGRDRLPTIEERNSLPYVTAVVKECLRWHPVTPLAVPHRVTVDDEYRGYHISAGSIVVGNAWAVLHDETRYPRPALFDPTRYLTPDGQLDKSAPDPTEACFGFGRRICPGRHFALDSIWISVACILATINIGKALDETSLPIEPKEEYTPGLLSHPVPFKANFTPRSEAAEVLINEA